MDKISIIKSKLEVFLKAESRVLVAIDGGCTSGKTTVADELSTHFDCNVFHMDDFFLRPEQRTAERFAEVGGNVDYERFKEEVLIPLSEGRAFSYRPFSCKEQKLLAPVSVINKQLNIIEGSYSLHLELEKSYTYKILLEIPPELQKKRILERNPILHKRFFEEWIPLEQKYFNETNIKNRCDLIINATE